MTAGNAGDDLVPIRADANAASDHVIGKSPTVCENNLTQRILIRAMYAQSSMIELQP